ncbi:MAG: fumarylacetoacetate hydrolase family protein [Vicinamibacterales bacterium]|jgi:2-keto-4-pentenoate hydratase|nr:hypothetical protein [Acidobacteriota bacterium]MDP7294451.1 fumarylacetoacetate hydrolase family protein [Vicinamibacterales bacterium]MDP7672540.1 fumarylacetoacetate hydrolase family protein [Vicinamibacterales bacterium]HJO39741.1 fumarylacetoacetate hydrolase family protein [Vicinamibacterales bacterium]
MTLEKTAGRMAGGRFIQIVVAAALPVLLSGCGAGAPEPAPTGGSAEVEAAPAVVPEPEVVVDPLTPEATDEEIVDHLVAVERQGVVSVELSRHFPNLDRARAYRLQRIRRDRKAPADPQVGWKIGWSRQTDPRVPIDPVFGHILQSHVYAPGRPISTEGFVGGEALVEAEVAVWLGRDLPGPDITRDDVLAAVTEVGGVIELLNPRVGPDGDGPNTHDHGIVDNVFHIGVMLGEQRATPIDVDWPAERVVVEVDGETRGEGRLSSVMGRDPIAGVVWLANELLAYGEQLRAGEFVITGTVVTPPPVAAGGSARLTFTTLGTVELAVE